MLCLITSGSSSLIRSANNFPSWTREPCEQINLLGTNFFKLTLLVR